VTSSGIYDPSADDIQVTRYGTHSAMIVPIDNRHSNTSRCIVKAMRGWATHANAFQQDDAALLRLLATAVSQVTNHHQQWAHALKLDQLSKAMFTAAHELMCCHDEEHVLSCVRASRSRLHAQLRLHCSCTHLRSPSVSANWS